MWGMTFRHAMVEYYEVGTILKLDEDGWYAITKRFSNDGHEANTKVTNYFDNKSNYETAR